MDVGWEIMAPWFYRSGRTIPGLTDSIIGRAGGRIMCGPGIICIGPPIGGRIPGPGKRHSIQNVVDKTSFTLT